MEHKKLWLDAKLSIIKEGQNNKIRKNEMSTKIDILCVGYLHGVATDSCSDLQVISSSILSMFIRRVDFTNHSDLSGVIAAVLHLSVLICLFIYLFIYRYY